MFLEKLFNRLRPEDTTYAAEYIDRFEALLKKAGAFSGRGNYFSRTKMFECPMGSFMVEGLLSSLSKRQLVINVRRKEVSRESLERCLRIEIDDATHGKGKSRLEYMDGRPDPLKNAKARPMVDLFYDVLERCNNCNRCENKPLTDAFQFCVDTVHN